MARLLMALLAVGVTLMGSASAGFYDDYRVIWGGQNIVTNDAAREVQLSLNQVAGASFATKQTYLYGSFSVRYRLTPGESAGTVSAFYVTSYNTNQDEIDFEFLGNETGQPYLLHTNIFADGQGQREQEINLWFDPAADFHNYTIIWNHKQITWLVDEIPIRIHKNSSPDVYPRLQPMGVHGTIFEASTWATRGGAVPIKWNKAPFVVTFRDFTFNACAVQNGDTLPCRTDIEKNWWEAQEFQSLSTNQIAQLKNVQQKYMTYNYCTDRVHHPNVPQECAANAV